MLWLNSQMDRVKRIWYLSPMRAAKVQVSLRIRAVSPELLLLAHTSSESRGTFRQKARSLASLNGWACTVKICHDGMLEDTNLLDGLKFCHCWWIGGFFPTTLAISRENTIFGGLQPGKTQQPVQLQRVSSLKTLGIESIGTCILLSKQQTRKTLIRLRGCAGWSVSLLFIYGIRRFPMTWHTYWIHSARSEWNNSKAL